jgi:hypothetical protein
MELPGVELEYFIEKIAGARKQANGSQLYRIRWYGSSKEDDTWEPVDHLPRTIVRRHHKRTGLPVPT